MNRLFYKLKFFIKKIPGVNLFIKYYLLPWIRRAFGLVRLKKNNHEKIITVIGRGHSGTRLISKTLLKSGIFMGNPLNGSFDLIPEDGLYETAKLAGNYVSYKGNYEWDFSKLRKGRIDGQFYYFMESYLKSIVSSDCLRKGWKIPETILFFPWMVRVFPEIKYIYFVRDPRDVICEYHLTDDLTRWNVPCDEINDIYEKRAVSWKYQWDIVKATPKPKHFLLIKFEDFVLKQEETLEKIEHFVGIPMEKVEVNPEKVGIWKRHNICRNIDFLKPALLELGYI